MSGEVCDVCGSTNIKEIKCKVVCQNCGTILKTCSDLEILISPLGHLCAGRHPDSLSKFPPRDQDLRMRHASAGSEMAHNLRLRARGCELWRRGWVSAQAAFSLAIIREDRHGS